MKLRIIIILLILNISALRAFSTHIPDLLTSTLFQDSIEHKQQVLFIPEFSNQIYKALSYYPELYTIKIHFKLKKIKTSMACRPSFFSVFKKRDKRIYNIFINTDTSRLKNAILKFVPENAQIGVIGHELAHIVDYHKKSFFRLFTTGICYLFSSYRSKLEKRIDILTINHGLKNELIEFSHYIIHISNAPEKYKNYKIKNYYSPEELKTL